MTGAERERRFFCGDPETTAGVGRALARAALPLPPEGLVVGLDGDLGAGKTHFVKGVAAGLGVPGELAVVSPTFTIARSYPTAAGVELHHVDAYRLRGAEDLELAGFEDLWGTGRLTCVEWAERVRSALPEARIEIRIDAARRGRRLCLRGRGAAPARVVDRLAPSRDIEEEGA